MKQMTLSGRLVPAPLVNLGRAAQRLFADLISNEAGDAHSRALVEHALAVATAAEERIAEQNRRIAFLERLSRTDELTGVFEPARLHRRAEEGAGPRPALGRGRRRDLLRRRCVQARQ